MGEFDNRYGYVRGLADKAFGVEFQPDAEIAPKRECGDLKVLSDVMARMNRNLRRQQDGYFASGAMVDAYFSRLEHRVLLLRAFIGRPLASGDFEAFLGTTWDERLRNVVDFRADPAWGRLLGRLRDLKATIRNPLAHGGVENDGGAFYFHVPRVGAIPANLSRYRGRLRMSFFPIADTTQAEICALFDEVDAMLTQGPMELPNEFVRWGIDPQFDADATTRYAEALAAGAESVEALVNQLGDAWERHANMDY